MGLGFLFLAAPAQAEFESQGFVALRSAAADAPPSWLEGGFGRLQGGDEAGVGVGAGVEARLQLSYDASAEWALRLHLGGRRDRAALGRRLGLIEAYVDRRWASERQHVQVRVGQFFLPTSLENIEALWVSPYTLTHSALNSWMGEEFRPLGSDLRLRRELDSGNQIELGLTVFGNNDASGALLAWRGFALHDRVSYFGESLPLPPLASLADPLIFGAQNAAVTKPFGPDLDGRPGYALRLRHGNALVGWQLTAVDTQGDRRLYRGEYAWRTRFVLLGGEYNPAGEGWGYAGEVLSGFTAMGEPGLPKVNVRLNTGYLLASYGADPWRYSVRMEAFDMDDLDLSIAENNEESGFAVTLAALRRFERWRVGIEYLYVDGNRPAAAAEGADLQAGGQQLKVELRYEF